MSTLSISAACPTSLSRWMIFRFSATAITGRGLADPLAALCDHPGDLRRLDLKIIQGLQEQLEENVLVFVAIGGDQSAQLWQRAVTAYYDVCAVDLLHFARRGL